MEALHEILQRVLSSRVEFLRTPEGLRLQRQAEREQAERLSKAIDEQCETRQIPATADIKPYLTAPAETPCILAVKRAAEWRRQRSTKQHSKALVQGLLGSCGRGKTVALAWCVYHHHKPALFVPAVTIAETERRYPNGDLWRLWESVDLLGLDEIADEITNRRAITRLFLTRYNKGLATIFSGNCNKREFAALYCTDIDGERLTDRLKGQATEGLPPITEDSGESFRTRKL